MCQLVLWPRERESDWAAVCVYKQLKVSAECHSRAFFFLSCRFTIG